ncbi:MAG: transposase [Myxococcales bacterium]|nr:transposase [Myxococcales bacterium]
MLAIETALALRLVYGLPGRQPEGLLSSLIRLMGLQLGTPDHTTLSRHARTPRIELARPCRSRPLHPVVDATGLKVFGQGVWAAGSMERANSTLQVRLVKELRLANISDVATANEWLPSYMVDHNRRFARAALDPNDVHRPLRSEDDLDRILTWRATRRVAKNLTLRFLRVLYLLDKTEAAYSAKGHRIDVDGREDGTVAF